MATVRKPHAASVQRRTARVHQASVFPVTSADTANANGTVNPT